MNYSRNMLILHRVACLSTHWPRGGVRHRQVTTGLMRRTQNSEKTTSDMEKCNRIVIQLETSTDTNTHHFNHCLASITV